MNIRVTAYEDNLKLKEAEEYSRQKKEQEERAKAVAKAEADRKEKEENEKILYEQLVKKVDELNILSNEYYKKTGNLVTYLNHDSKFTVNKYDNALTYILERLCL